MGDKLIGGKSLLAPVYQQFVNLHKTAKNLVIEDRQAMI